MAEAATRQRYTCQTEQLVSVVPELAADEIIRHRTVQFIGAVAAGAWNQSAEVSATAVAEEALQLDPKESLHGAIYAANAGDLTARQMVEINASKMASELIYKAGHVSEISLTLNEANKIEQFNQTLESVHANSLRWASGNPRMLGRSKAEAYNLFGIEHFLREGTLHDHYYVVASRTDDKMSLEELEESHFFTDTMSCSFQATTAEAGGLTMESAFVAGVRAPGAPRHDEETLRKMAAGLGINIDGMDATQLLASAWLVPKSLMPDGVINLVERFDDAAGDTFFGEAKPRQDYRQHRRDCDERERDFQPKVKLIVTDLLAEGQTITSPIMAVERLHKIVEKHMIDQAIADMSINPGVFGPAAAHIEMARRHLEQGDVQAMLAEQSWAIRTARTVSCPNGMGGDQIAKRHKQTSDGEGGESKDDDDSTTGIVRCIKCRVYVPKQQVVKADRWQCPNCNHTVDICDGKVRRQGVEAQSVSGEQTTPLLNVWRDIRRTRNFKSSRRGRLALSAV